MRTDFTDALVSQECVVCSITFAMTATVERDLKRSFRTFQCPNGHGQSFKGVAEKEQLTAEIERLRAEINRDIARIAGKNDEIAARDRTNNTLRGVITKLKKANAVLRGRANA